jgi:hypothetical protein
MLLLRGVRKLWSNALGNSLIHRPHSTESEVVTRADAVQLSPSDVDPTLTELDSTSHTAAAQNGPSESTQAATRDAAPFVDGDQNSSAKVLPPLEPLRGSMAESDHSWKVLQYESDPISKKEIPASSNGNERSISRQATQDQEPSQSSQQRVDEGYNPAGRLPEISRRLKETYSHVLSLRLQVDEEFLPLGHEIDALIDQQAESTEHLNDALTKADMTKLELCRDKVKNLQASQGNLRTRNEIYKQLKHELEIEEAKMKYLEMEYHQHLMSQHNEGLGEGGVATIGSEPQSRPSSLSTHSGPIESSPRVNAYLSRKGDAGLLRERLAELRLEQATLAGEEIIRTRELEQAEDDIRNMEENLPDKDDPITGLNPLEEHLVQESPIADDSLDGRRSIASADILERRDPLLLPSLGPSQMLPELLRRNEERISTPSYVEAWLLHKLRTSASEIDQLQSADDLKHLGLSKDSKEAIRDYVEDLWSKDGASAQLITGQLTEQQATGESATQVVQGISNQVSRTEAVNSNVLTHTEPLPPSTPRDDGGYRA